MRVLGIDPGTRHLGWGVIERNGTKITHIAHGVISTDATRPLVDRLVEIDDALTQVIDAHAPTCAAVEALFYSKDPQAAAKLGHARGVILLKLARARIDVFEYPPARVKRAVVGSGNADKEQVGRIMMSILGLRDVPRLDASDALANAFAHLTMARFQDALAASVPPSPKPRRAPRAARAKRL
jgi:crossover junction endodeoxyribonuclease RuvC